MKIAIIVMSVIIIVLVFVISILKCDVDFWKGIAENEKEHSEKMSELNIKFSNDWKEACIEMNNDWAISYERQRDFLKKLYQGKDDENVK